MGLPAGSVEFALAVLFVVRLYSVLRGEALRFLVFALISVVVLNDYRSLIWAIVFDAAISAAENLLKMWR